MVDYIIEVNNEVVYKTPTNDSALNDSALNRAIMVVKAGAIYAEHKQPTMLRVRNCDNLDSKPIYYIDADYELYPKGKRYVEVHPSISFQRLTAWEDSKGKEYVLYGGKVLELIEHEGAWKIFPKKNPKQKKPSKITQVAEYLEKNGFITSWGAIEMFRATRLSSIIFNLRKRGWVIESRYKENDGTRYVEYVLVEKGR